MVKGKFVIESANTSRYTYDGDAEVEARIAHDQQLIGAAVKQLIGLPAFRALVLIGGYGRGEGGYCYQDGQPAPYNDYDYFVVVRGLNARALAKLSPELNRIAKELEHKVGVEVDLFFLREELLPELEYSLMFAEMQWGSRVVIGDSDVLKSMSPMPIEKLSLSEFTRLMLNRGALLLMNRQVLFANAQLNEGQREIVVKYLFKAILASGDAYLAALGCYHPSYPEKLRLLQTFSDDAGIAVLLEQYVMALDARFHPDYSKYTGRDLYEWQAQVCNLWLTAFKVLESKRMGMSFDDWSHYASRDISKGQSGQGAIAMLRNLAVTARDFGLNELMCRPGWSLRYPRERLISTLPLLLLQNIEHETPLLVEQALGGQQITWQQATEIFLKHWKRYA
jgi:hypothetical protein